MPATIPGLLLAFFVLLFYYRYRQLLTKSDLRRARGRAYAEIAQGYMTVMGVLTVIGIALTLWLKPLMVTLFFGKGTDSADIVEVKVKPKPVAPVQQIAVHKIQPAVIYHGTDEQDFAKDRVEVDGQILSNISLVLPTTGGKVSVVFAIGGRNIPAYKLPQGFLDAWGITPDRLRRMDQPQAEVLVISAENASHGNRVARVVEAGKN